MKAIELVYRAQPMIAALREVASQCQGAKHGNAASQTPTACVTYTGGAK